MPEIGERNENIAGAEVHFERAAGVGVPLIGDAELPGVFSGNGEDGEPVHSVDVQARMGGGDVEQARGRVELRGHALRGGEHHGHSVFREVDPDLIFNV